MLHIFVPRESNNHKAKILHPSGLFVIVALLVALQGIINFVPKVSPHILGYAANISIQDVVNLTNQKRAEAGLPALALNQTLSNAAYTKGRDMIDKDYWAHVSPDGTQPWKFFSQFGYKYRYAGENLARDFSNAGDAVNAWMNSPTHRDNILNAKYKEIGIGITEGDLAGSDSTIIVQFFGATYADRVAEPLAQAQTTETVGTPKPATPIATRRPTSAPTALPTVEPTEAPVVIVMNTDAPVVQSIITTPQSDQQVLISPFTTTKNTSYVVLGLLLVVFIVDAYLVTKRKISRIAGRTFAHVAFLAMILTLVYILKSGNIL